MLSLVCQHCGEVRPAGCLLRRGNRFVEDPYTKARFQPECEGKLSPVGELSRIGASASGLFCSPTQR